MLIVIVAFVLASVFVIISSILPAFTGAPWVPMPKETVRKMLLLSGVKPGEELCDLGAGDGRIVVMAAREFGARSAGVEIDPFRAFYSKVLILVLGLRGKARIVRSSFYDVDLRKADVVTLYLLQETNDKLRPKLERELKPTSRVVSHVFKFDWVLLDSDEAAKIYVYSPRTRENAGKCLDSQRVSSSCETNLPKTEQSKTLHPCFSNSLTMLGPP